eukprot:TRINITY_DN7648_c0_g1_i1.p1 TRINITY_DN7648_c0_g1~~TRINITY_DN7648_c0_g1_i1.p1  ORF type:complete len:742 (-),score=184.30 TRINITY_DN7648_c0_g1_i1:2252-4477(-)
MEEVREVEVKVQKAVSSKTLNLSGLGLYNLDSINLEPIDFLKKIDLYKNNLDEIPPFVFHFDHMLEQLNLFRNRITLISPQIEVFSNIRVLHLGSNKITVLPDELYSLTSLENLDMSNNQISYISDAISNLENLRELKLYRNTIRSIPSGIGGLTKLNRLDIYNNEIRSLPTQFANLTSLVMLNINENPLVSPPITLVKRGVPMLMKYILENVAVPDLSSASGIGLIEPVAGKPCAVLVQSKNKENENIFSGGDLITVDFYESMEEFMEKDIEIEISESKVNRTSSNISEGKRSKSAHNVLSFPKDITKNVNEKQTLSTSRKRTSKSERRKRRKRRNKVTEDDFKPNSPSEPTNAPEEADEKPEKSTEVAGTEQAKPKRAKTSRRRKKRKKKNKRKRAPKSEDVEAKKEKIVQVIEEPVMEYKEEFTKDTLKELPETPIRPDTLMMSGLWDPNSVSVVDNMDGSYTITYTPPREGDFVLAIKMNGKHICDSPFDINIKEDPDRNLEILKEELERQKIYQEELEHAHQIVKEQYTEELQQMLQKLNEVNSEKDFYLNENVKLRANIEEQSEITRNATNERDALRKELEDIKKMVNNLEREKRKALRKRSNSDSARINFENRIHPKSSKNLRQSSISSNRKRKKNHHRQKSDHSDMRQLNHHRKPSEDRPMKSPRRSNYSKSKPSLKTEPMVERPKRRSMRRSQTTRHSEKDPQFQEKLNFFKKIESSQGKKKKKKHKKKSVT